MESHCKEWSSRSVGSLQHSSSYDLMKRNPKQLYKHLLIFLMKKMDWDHRIYFEHFLLRYYGACGCLLEPSVVPPVTEGDVGSPDDLPSSVYLQKALHSPEPNPVHVCSLLDLVSGVCRGVSVNPCVTCWSSTPAMVTGSSSYMSQHVNKLIQDPDIHHLYIDSSQCCPRVPWAGCIHINAVFVCVCKYRFSQETMMT